MIIKKYHRQSRRFKLCSWSLFKSKHKHSLLGEDILCAFCLFSLVSQSQISLNWVLPEGSKHIALKTLATRVFNAIRRRLLGNGNTWAGFLVLSPCNHTGFLLENRASHEAKQHGLANSQTFPGLNQRVIRYSLCVPQMLDCNWL